MPNSSLKSDEKLQPDWDRLFSDYKIWVAACTQVGDIFWVVNASRAAHIWLDLNPTKLVLLNFELHLQKADFVRKSQLKSLKIWHFVYILYISPDLLQPWSWGGQSTASLLIQLIHQQLPQVSQLDVTIAVTIYFQGCLADCFWEFPHFNFRRICCLWYFGHACKGKYNYLSLQPVIIKWFAVRVNTTAAIQCNNVSNFQEQWSCCWGRGYWRRGSDFSGVDNRKLSRLFSQRFAK